MEAVHAAGGGPDKMHLLTDIREAFLVILHVLLRRSLTSAHRCAPASILVNELVSIYI